MSSKFRFCLGYTYRLVFSTFFLSVLPFSGDYHALFKYTRLNEIKYQIFEQIYLGSIDGNTSFFITYPHLNEIYYYKFKKNFFIFVFTHETSVAGPDRRDIHWLRF